jgi:hypothetical protein
MKGDKVNQERLEYVAKAKAAYRRHAQAMTWEEKIASIVRMRNASKIAKAGGAVLRKAEA